MLGGYALQKQLPLSIDRLIAFDKMISAHFYLVIVVLDISAYLDRL